MDLKDFVAESISSIVQGISEAQSSATKLGASINPGGLMRNAKNVTDNSIWDNSNNNYAQPISFDIAITAEDSASGGAKVKVLSGLLGGEAGGQTGTKNVLASRIQFTVPVLFPAHAIEKDGAGKVPLDKSHRPNPTKPVK